MMARKPTLTLIAKSSTCEWSENERRELMAARVARVLGGEPVSSPDPFGGRLSPEHRPGGEQGGTAMLDRSMKMLVADDADAIRAVFRQVAQRSCGLISLIEASNGRDCVKLLSRSDIDLAFIDVYMPEMSGLEALRGARHVGIKTFVTLMSGSGRDDFLDVARQLRAYEFLRKPFRVRDVERIIDTYRRVAKPAKVLVVDDSMTVRRIIQRVLAGSIFRMDCYEAPDGETALAFCASVAFDVIFLDCNMPGLDGLATLDRLMLRNPDAKVVMISSERDTNRETRALRRGAAAFMHKPFYPPDIDAALHRLFGLKSPDLLAGQDGEAAAAQDVWNRPSSGEPPLTRAQGDVPVAIATTTRSRRSTGSTEAR
jgi:CheY-like chemotaxis protein